MEFIRNLLNKFRKPQSLDINTVPYFENEDEYYEWFFTQNENWNKPTPNNDELLRWNGIKDFLTELPGSKTELTQILDLGCGRGWLTNLLSTYGTVTGVEPVATVVKYANGIFPELNIIAGNANTLLANGYAGKFDIIVSSEVLEHIPDDKKDEFAKGMNELLKEGGYAIISTPRKEVQEEYCKLSNLTQPVEEWIAEKDVEDLFVKNSFNVIGLKRLTRKHATPETSLELYQLWLFKKNN